MSTKFMDTSGSKRRHYRVWPDALKSEIVAASYEAGASVSVVARRYDVNANQIFKWRKQPQYCAGGKMSSGIPALIPVRVVAGTEDTVPQSARPIDRVEIALPDGCRVHVGGVDTDTLRLILEMLTEAAQRGKR